MDDRKAFAAIVYVLRTGIQWNALPRELGASSTVHDRFQEWERAGFFEELWGVRLAEYDEMEGVEWEWQAIDGVMTKAPLGRDATGKNPTDRAKSGTKRSMLTDGAGIPLSIAIEGANRLDAKLLVATLEGLVVARPALEEEDEQQNMCLDAAYDSEPVREELSERLRTSHASDRQEGEGARRSGAWSQWAGQALGSGTDTLVAEPFSTATGALGEESRELPSVHLARLRPAHIFQDNGFRIRT